MSSRPPKCTSHFGIGLVVGRTYPQQHPGNNTVCGDKGYSSRRIRAYLRRRGIRYTIPRKTNERRTGPFNRALYRQRNLVERTINRLKQFRRIATRYEKKAENYRLCFKNRVRRPQGAKVQRCFQNSRRTCRMPHGVAKIPVVIGIKSRGNDDLIGDSAWLLPGLD